MNKGRIKNFTLEGNALTLAAMVDKSGDTRYQLDTSMFEGRLTYNELVSVLEAVQADIENMFKLWMTYATDDKGELIHADDGSLIQAGNKIHNSHVEAFEREWSNAQSE